MSNVQTLRTRVKGVADEVYGIRESVGRALNGIQAERPVSQDASIRDLKAKQEEYERQFVEKEAELQALGGRSRKQTLQEFVLLFFYISYLIFTVSAVLYTRQTGGSSQKIGLLLLAILLVVTGILIRYA